MRKDLYLKVGVGQGSGFNYVTKQINNSTKSKYGRDNIRKAKNNIIKSE